MAAVRSTGVWIFIIISSGTVWNCNAAINDQLHTFASKDRAFRGVRLGVIFVASCNHSICLTSFNLVNKVHVSVDLGGTVEPSILGFLDTKLYLGYSADGLDYLSAINLYPECKRSKCQTITMSVSQPSHKLGLGATDTIGGRIFLFYHAIHMNNPESTRMCIYTPTILKVDCIFDFDSTIRHAAYDPMSSALYYTTCTRVACQAFRLAFDLSSGFPKPLGEPVNLFCISYRIATPAFATWYENSHSSANLYFPVKKNLYSKSVNTWNSRLHTCIGGEMPKLPPETRSVSVTLSYTTVLLPDNTIIVFNQTYRYLLPFHEKIHLLAFGSFDHMDYKFDRDCLIPDLLSPEVILVPVYRSVARVNLRRPYVSKISSLEDWFRSKCQNISLPHFVITATIKSVKAPKLMAYNGTTVFLHVVDYMGIVHLYGLVIGEQYEATVSWANKYTRDRRLGYKRLSHHFNWTVESFPELANLTLAPYEATIVSNDSSVESGKSNSYVIAFGISAGCSALLLGGILVAARLVFRKRTENRSSISSKDAFASEKATADIQIECPEAGLNLRGAGTGRSAHYTSFLMELKAITDGFSALPKFSMADVEVLQEVGRGAFGTVFEAIFLDHSAISDVVSCSFALKSVDDFQELIKEAEVMESLNHPNIVKIYGICLDPEYPHIALEYMLGGSLMDHLTLLASNNIPLMANDQISILKDLASALCYLEGRRLVHRDVAARNCLLSANFAHSKNAKLSDFGMTRPTLKDYYRLKNSMVLPIRWLAPECITLNVFTSKTDVWAFGILIWEIITLGLMPYPEKTDQEVVEYIRKGGHPHIPVEDNGIFHLMIQCWDVHPDERISATDVWEYLCALEKRILMCSKDNELYFRLQMDETD